MKYFLLVLMSLYFSTVHAESVEHGTVKTVNNNTVKIWNADSQQWMDIESFWLDYANKKGGLVWGKTGKYPEYSKVKEGDTILIVLPQGNCLMEFFHERWRRANDVRRWHDAVNDYGGCPYVFN